MFALSETGELGGLWPNHGRPGEAGCRSQHSAQRSWDLQVAALHQLSRQQGEQTCLNENTFTGYLTWDTSDTLSTQPVNFLLVFFNLNEKHVAFLSFRRNTQTCRNSTTIYWWAELITCSTASFIFEFYDEKPIKSLSEHSMGDLWDISHHFISTLIFTLWLLFVINSHVIAYT